MAFSPVNMILANQPQQSQQPISQPVVGPPTAVPGAQTLPPGTPGPIGSSPQSPPNPYNLPMDIVQGMSQKQQFDNLLGQFESSRQSANRANEQRYGDILQGYSGIEGRYAQRTNDLMGMLGGLGQSQQAALQRKFEQQKAGLQQSLVNRGMYNSSVFDAQNRGLDEAQNQQMLDLNDALTRQKLEFGAQLTGQELGNLGNRLQFMERRDDTGPSYQEVAGLSGAVGQGRAPVPDYLSAIGFQGIQGGGAAAGGGPGGAPGSAGPSLPPPSIGSPAPPSSQAPSSGTPVYTSPIPGSSGIKNVQPKTRANITLPNQYSGGGSGGSSGGRTSSTMGSSMGPAPSGGGQGSTSATADFGGLSGRNINASSPENAQGASEDLVYEGSSSTGKATREPGYSDESSRSTPGYTESDAYESSNAKEPFQAPATASSNVNQELSGNKYFQDNIAPGLKANPNWDWVWDNAVYAAAPFPLQKRIEEIRRTRNQ